MVPGVSHLNTRVGALASVRNVPQRFVGRQQAPSRNAHFPKISGKLLATTGSMLFTKSFFSFGEANHRVVNSFGALSVLVHLPVLAAWAPPVEPSGAMQIFVKTLTGPRPRPNFLPSAHPCSPCSRA